MNVTFTYVHVHTWDFYFLVIILSLIKWFTLHFNFLFHLLNKTKQKLFLNRKLEESSQMWTRKKKVNKYF